MERFGGVEGLADEREGFSRKGVVVKMIENREDDLLCYMTKGAGKWVVHFSGFERLLGDGAESKSVNMVNWVSERAEE